jgi:helix-turn-helix protein
MVCAMACCGVPRPEPAKEHQRPALSIADAATRCGVDRSTVRRRLDRGELPGAWREPGPQGRWMIPVASLVAAGLQLTSPDQGHAPGREQGHAIANEQDELGRLREQLAEWRTRALVAESLSEERRQTLERMDRAMLMLEIRTGATAPSERSGTGDVQEPSPAGATGAPPRARRRWWQRG